MKKLLFLATVVFVVTALICPAQEAKPDFTGKWVLDKAKSDFGQMPAPDTMSRVIDHKEPKMKIAETGKSERGERSSERNITTDGRENKNIFGSVEFVSRSKWEGKRLATEGKLKTQNGDFEINETMELNEDGKVMSLNRTFKGPQGEATQKLTLNKE